MNWVELRALNQLYENGKVKVTETLAQSGEVGYLVNSLGVLERDRKEIRATSDFNVLYQRDYLNRYLKYSEFLRQLEILTPHTRLEETDINILIDIHQKMVRGDLDELRKQIIASDESVKGVSLMFFKNEKYLKHKGSLIDALKKILKVEHFSYEKDQQYIYKLECYAPKAIVLCENLDFLTKPDKPRNHHIELWYAGGKNVPKLDFSSTRGLPIYYSCDWDYDGLYIIYPLVKEKIPGICLLYPNGAHKSIVESEHKSLWKGPRLVDNNIFSEREHQLISTLIREDCWIIEESNDLIEMMKDKI